jgi:transcriptional regulator with XRE-family HTH domain
MNRLELRTWRRVRYLAQRELGDLLGVGKMTVWRWESGESTIPPYLALALAHLDTLHRWSPEGIDALPRIGRIAG